MKADNSVRVEIDEEKIYEGSMKDDWELLKPKDRDAAVQSNPIYKNPVRHIPKTGTFRYIMQKEPVQSGT